MVLPRGRREIVVKKINNEIGLQSKWNSGAFIDRVKEGREKKEAQWEYLASRKT